MLRRITCSVALSAGKADCSRLLSNNIAADRSPYIAIQTQLWVQQHCSFTSSSGWLLQQPQQQIRQLLHHRSRLTPAAADAALVQSPPVAGQQWQQQRMLLGAVKHRNYQDHNKQKAKKYKIKTPSIAKRRVVVSDDGTMWRMQAGRRHKRYKKNRLRLLDLKGMVPLHSAHAAKLRKLGFNRKWWHTLKA